MRNRVLLLCLVSGLLLVPRVNWAAEKCFLFLSDIPGESQDAHYVNWIDVDSWSWGESSMAQSGGGSAGKVSSQDFHFVMKMSVASPLILSACATGKHIQEARLVCRKNQTDYLGILFRDVIVSSYQTGGSGQSNVGPTDQISFNFFQISLEYFRLGSDGKTLGGAVRSGFDVKNNTYFSPGPIIGTGPGAQGGGSSSGGAAPGQVPPPAQAPVKTTPPTISPKPTRVPVPTGKP